jgi:DNA-binding MarR family transcriptional regulator
MDRLRNFGFLLKDLSERYVRRFEQRAQAIALTLPQCKALVFLERNQSLSQAKLAELVNVQPMAMVRILDHMEADGLLERRPDPADRRARCLYLTARAKPVLQRIWRLAEETRAEVFEGVSQKDRDHFIGVLERLHANVCALGVPADAPAAVPAAAVPARGRARATQPAKRK